MIAKPVVVLVTFLLRSVEMSIEVTLKLAKFLSQEVCKDLDYDEIYKLAEEAMSRRFMRKYNVKSLCEDYGERYDYVFLDNGIEPAL
jgi:hypothetical protein